MAGGVGTAELTPISATLPITRTNGKSAAPAGQARPLRIGRHVGGPALHAGVAPDAAIDVVVARHDAHPLPAAPGTRASADAMMCSCGSPMLHEVAAHGDVVGRLRQHVGDDAVESAAQMRVAALAHPVGVAEPALHVPVARREPRKGRQVHVGQVRDGDGASSWRQST